MLERENACKSVIHKDKNYRKAQKNNKKRKQMMRQKKKPLDVHSAHSMCYFPYLFFILRLIYVYASIYSTLCVQNNTPYTTTTYNHSVKQQNKEKELYFFFAITINQGRENFFFIRLFLVMQFPFCPFHFALNYEYCVLKIERKKKANKRFK